MKRRDSFCPCLTRINGPGTKPLYPQMGVFGASAGPSFAKPDFARISNGAARALLMETPAIGKDARLERNFRRVIGNLDIFALAGGLNRRAIVNLSVTGRSRKLEPAR